MRGSEAAVGSLRTMAAEQFGGSLETVNEWDIAVLHREHAAGDGACVRCAWAQLPAGELDRMIDTFAHTALPEVEGMTGFCSASFFVDRSSGRTVGAMAWDSRDAMDASRDTLDEMRSAAITRLGGTVLDVQEFDLAIAHLRVPELV